jgi:YD repeat-containing protein
MVTDPLGVKTSITHNALGAVSSITDDEGVTATIEYDEANRPTRASDSAGNVQTFASEAVDKGGATAYTYDARGNVLSARSGNPATSYRAVRNGRGQPLSLKAESGREMTFEYDAAGNETAFTYSDVGRFEKSYDGAGRKISERMPSGRSLGYKYDAHGQIAKVTDNSARSLTIERDASGMIAKIMSDDSTQVQITRDGAGRPTRLDFPDGKSRQYAYDARGALTYYRDARGRQYQMSYNRMGRLQKVDKSDGVTLHYRYGRDGHIASVRREVRGQEPGFVKASFNFLPRLAARDYETEEGCFIVYDGFGVWYDLCDPYSYYLDAEAVVETWYEYARGSMPLHGSPNPPNDCLRFKFAACNSYHEACLRGAAETATYAVIACLALTSRLTLVICLSAVAIGYTNGVMKCDSTLEGCRLEAQGDCAQQ